VFATADGPCYRCLHPEPPPPDVIPSCAEAGVLGVLPGVIGSIQATEAIKLILGIGESLAGRILIYDALRLRFREVRLRRAPDCPVCSPRRTIRTLSAYRAACEPAAGDGGELPEVGARELSQARQAGAPIVLLDVREPGEHAICRIEGARLLPLAGLPGGVADLDRNADLVVFCKSGVRSASAVRYLRQEGFTRARNLRGGIVAWINEVDPTLATY
jgi:adenylyltransferase/sulfurtransferase